MATELVQLTSTEYTYRGHIIKICFCPHTDSEYWQIYKEGVRIKSSDLVELGWTKSLIHAAKQHIDFTLEEYEE